MASLLNVKSNRLDCGSQSQKQSRHGAHRIKSMRDRIAYKSTAIAMNPLIETIFWRGWEAPLLTGVRQKQIKNGHSFSDLFLRKG
jgi:hypothetical protein